MISRELHTFGFDSVAMRIALTVRQVIPAHLTEANMRMKLVLPSPGLICMLCNLKSIISHTDVTRRHTRHLEVF